MRKREVDAALADAARVDRAALAGPGLEEARRELLERILAQPQEARPTPALATGRGGRRLGAGLRGGYLALGTALGAAAAVVALAIGIGAGSAGAPSRAFGADLARLTKASPHLLINGRGWRIQRASLVTERGGTIEFFREAGGGLLPLSGRGRNPAAARAELKWSFGATGAAGRDPGGAELVRVAKAPAIGVTAHVFAVPGPGSGGRRYEAVWSQGGRRLEFGSVAPSLAAFERRLVLLRLVPGTSWMRELPSHDVRSRELTTFTEAEPLDHNRQRSAR
jgi:hypothetical protein